MPSTKKQKSNIIDLPTKRAEKAKKRSSSTKGGETPTISRHRAVVALGGLQVTSGITGRSIVIPPKHPDEYDAMLRMVTNAIMPEYLRFLAEEKPTKKKVA